MHAICHTPTFTRDAATAGMTNEELASLEDMLARNPSAGDEIVGSGGCRKVRLAGKGKGKSGGYRVIHFFTGPDLPVFLLTVFAKNERANLSKAERNQLARLTDVLASEYRKKIAKSGEKP